MGPRWKFIQRHLRVPQDYRDQVVEIMRHTAGQAANPFELLSLLELRLELPAIDDLLRGCSL